MRLPGLLDWSTQCLRTFWLFKTGTSPSRTLADGLFILGPVRSSRTPTQQPISTFDPAEKQTMPPYVLHGSSRCSTRTWSQYTCLTALQQELYNLQPNPQSQWLLPVTNFNDDSPKSLLSAFSTGSFNSTGKSNISLCKKLRANLAIRIFPNLAKIGHPRHPQNLLPKSTSSG